MKQHKKKLILILGIICLLILAFWWGGNAPGTRGFLPQPETEVNEIIEEPEQNESSEKVQEDVPANVNEKTENNPDANVPEKTEEIKREEQKTTADTERTCTLSVRCDTILDNLSYLSEHLHSMIPDDGVILHEKTVLFRENETVLQVLRRELKREGIHCEVSDAYIEGIQNIYEFDCGEGSGWMYKVNGVFPSYSSKFYKLQSGDEVVFLYTCNRGKDIGGVYGTQNQ